MNKKYQFQNFMMIIKFYLQRISGRAHKQLIKKNAKNIYAYCTHTQTNTYTFVNYYLLPQIIHKKTVSVSIQPPVIRFTVGLFYFIIHFNINLVSQYL